MLDDDIYLVAIPQIPANKFYNAGHLFRGIHRVPNNRLPILVKPQIFKKASNLQGIFSF